MNLNFIRQISVRTGFLTFTFVAIASLAGGFLTACSNASQNQSQAPNATATNARDMQNMEHGSGMNHDTSMNHNMAMDLGPADADYDLRFIDAMTVHHQGAVAMAKEAQQKSQRPELRQLVENIVQDQTKEITQMKQWREAWYSDAGDKPMAYHAQMGHMMEMSSDQMKGMMMSDDLGAADAEFDLRFIKAMIAHHEGALTMAEDALSKSKRPEVKQLAQAIATSQQAEIGQMKQWRQAWYK